MSAWWRPIDVSTTSLRLLFDRTLAEGLDDRGLQPSPRVSSRRFSGRLRARWRWAAYRSSVKRFWAKKKKKNLGTRSHLIIHWTAEKQAMMGGPPTMLGTSQVRSTALSSGMVVLSEQSHDLVGNGVKRSHLFLFCFWVNKWQHPLVPCYCFCFGSN